ncbi:MAG TPA: peptidylprolyl isomerase [Pirellulales bacterium]|jgi:peptidyl-prolyl cis-trans isomerase A (cyclophilin A)|nr:peptidylprolyl isomerase [Pirellulales bacterium]
MRCTLFGSSAPAAIPRSFSRQWPAWPVALAVTLLATVQAGSTFATTVPTSTLLTFSTNMGSFQVDLFDQVVGATVNNFLGYVNSNAYQNTLVHRSVNATTEGIGVVQGGGYIVNSQSGTLTHIATPTTTNLQYDLNNSVGTIAMARTSDPNSASSEWFINTVDNSSSLGAANGGGYAVFGQVMAGGMSIVNSIYALPKSTVQGFPDFPLRNWSTGQAVGQANYVFTNNITVVKSHPAFENPNTPNDVNNDGVLSPADALQVINNLVTGHGPHTAAQVGLTYEYIDTNGDGTISASDALQVIHALVVQAQSNAQPASQEASFSTVQEQVSPFFVTVPEPSAWVLATLGAAAVMGVALKRRHGLRAV